MGWFDNDTTYDIVRTEIEPLYLMLSGAKEEDQLEAEQELRNRTIFAV